MENKEKIFTPKDLEGLGAYVGKEIYMEIRGGEPVVSGRREVALRGKIVAVDERSKEKTVTIQIPLSHLTTLSNNPLRPDEEDNTNV